MIDLSVESARSAYKKEEVQAILKNEEVDVVISLPIFGNEASYYLAHKKNASLVLFMTAPYGFPHINWAMGDSVNPSFMPSPVTGFSQHMNFVERFLNTCATAIFVLTELFLKDPSAGLPFNKVCFLNFFLVTFFYICTCFR